MGTFQGLDPRSVGEEGRCTAPLGPVTGHARKFVNLFFDNNVRNRKPWTHLLKDVSKHHQISNS